MECASPRRIAQTAAVIALLMLALTPSERASAETFEVDLPSVAGAYDASTERTAEIDLGLPLFEISSVAVRWSGTITTGKLQCWDGEPRGTGGEFEAGFVSKPPLYAYHSETSDVIGEQLAFTDTDAFPAHGSRAYDFLLEGTATIHVAFRLDRTIPECTLAPPYATGTLESVTLVIVGRRMYDREGDGDVDLDDFMQFQACFDGPNRPPARPDCDDMDSDGDNDVDLDDFAAFQACFNGPNQSPSCP